MTTAHQQAKDILEISRSWVEAFPQAEAVELLRTTKADYIMDTFTPREPLPQAMQIDGRKQLVTFDSPSWLILPPESASYASSDAPPAIGDNFRGKFFMSPPTNLANFEQKWNWLREVRILPLTETANYVALFKRDQKGEVSSSSQIEIIDFYPADGHQKGENEFVAEFTLEPLPLANAKMMRQALEEHRYGGKHSDAPHPEYAWIATYFNTSYFLVWPVPFINSNPRTVNLQAGLIRRFPNRWRKGTFSESFRELDTIASDYKDLPLERIAKILQGEEGRTREPFEAFGVKFPPDKTSRWGVLLVVGIQMYFFIHLAEYRRRRLHDASIAWIGSYDHGFSKAIFVAMTLVLPSSVVIFVTMTGHLFQTRFANWISGGAAICASVLFATLAGRAYQNLKN